MDQAFRFDGVDDCVNVPGDGINGLRNNLTVMAWFRYESFGENVAAKVLSKRVAGGFAPFEINIRKDGAVFSQGSTAGKSWDVGTGETQLTPRVWYHAAFVVDSGNVHSFYVNDARRGVRCEQDETEWRNHFYEFDDHYVPTLRYSLLVMVHRLVERGL